MAGGTKSRRAEPNGILRKIPFRSSEAAESWRAEQKAIYRVGILPINAEFFLIVHGKSLLFQPVALVLIVSYIFR